jgi:hypothetical protein
LNREQFITALLFAVANSGIKGFRVTLGGIRLDVGFTGLYVISSC